MTVIAASKNSTLWAGGISGDSVTEMAAWPSMSGVSMWVDCMASQWLSTEAIGSCGGMHGSLPAHGMHFRWDVDSDAQAPLPTSWCIVGC